MANFRRNFGRNTFDKKSSLIVSCFQHFCLLIHKLLYFSKFGINSPARSSDFVINLKRSSEYQRKNSAQKDDRVLTR